jgi:hypothetical protein
MWSQIIRLLCLLPVAVVAAPSIEGMELPLSRSLLASTNSTKTETRALNLPEERANACCGVYICDGLNFDGNCYWACYPWKDKIVPDPYFQRNAGSFGPDPGCQCFPEGLDDSGCDNSLDGHDITKYPGGNLGICINNLASFHCNP